MRSTVSFPRPHPLRGKRGLLNLDRFLGLAGSVRARRHRCIETNLGSDWSVMLLGRGPTIQIYIACRQWRFAFLRLASHMTALKLQSHWSAQIPFPGPRIVSKFTRPFSLAEGGGVWARDYACVDVDLNPFGHKSLQIYNDFVWTVSRLNIYMNNSLAAVRLPIRKPGPHNSCGPVGTLK